MYGFLQYNMTRDRFLIKVIPLLLSYSYLVFRVFPSSLALYHKLLMILWELFIKTI